MKIKILNGSPRKENTAAMAEAFREGAESAGHEVEILNVGKMKIAGCLGCEYCHGRGEGRCVQRDDMDEVIPALQEADVLVFASPIYYFTMTAQTEAAIQRMYCIGKPAKASKAVLLLSAASGPFEPAIAQFNAFSGYTGIEAAGVFTAAGPENRSEAKLAEIRNFARNL